MIYVFWYYQTSVECLINVSVKLLSDLLFLLDVLDIVWELEFKPLALLAAHELNIPQSVEAFVLSLDETFEIVIAVIVVLAILVAVQHIVQRTEVDDHHSQHDQVEEGQLDQNQTDVGVDKHDEEGQKLEAYLTTERLLSVKRSVLNIILNFSCSLLEFFI